MSRGWTVSVAGSLASSTLLAGSAIAQDQPVKRTELLRRTSPPADWPRPGEITRQSPTRGPKSKLQRDSL